MLPETISDGDVRWFQAHIVRIPVHHRVLACEAYAKVWQETFDAEPELRFKEGKARFEANTRLRRYIDRVHASLKR